MAKLLNLDQLAQATGGTYVGAKTTKTALPVDQMVSQLIYAAIKRKLKHAKYVSVDITQSSLVDGSLALEALVMLDPRAARRLGMSDLYAVNYSMKVGKSFEFSVEDEDTHKKLIKDKCPRTYVSIEDFINRLNQFLATL